MKSTIGRISLALERTGDAAVITFGSASAVTREAIARARAQGMNIKLVAMRLLAPARPEQMRAALQGVERVLVVEQNHGAQLYRYLRAHFDIDARMSSFHRPGPLPLRPADLLQAMIDWRNAQ